MAEKMAADPDDQIASSRAVRAVVKAMLTQRQSEDAMFAIQNIQNVREREQAMPKLPHGLLVLVRWRQLAI